VPLIAQVVMALQAEVAAITAVGALLLAGSVMVTVRWAVPTLPQTSLTVRTIVYVPGAA
jgi:hypothetical protein